MSRVGIFKVGVRGVWRSWVLWRLGGFGVLSDREFWEVAGVLFAYRFVGVRGRLLGVRYYSFLFGRKRE